ncbi:MAG: GNAT family N-acetyltransferase [Proteobacteria bacterium]|nr:GNAT family N-acetyltransferase [Pseudomonadota bacterium]
MKIIIRSAEPGDAEAFQRIFMDPKVYANTLQIPFPSIEFWRKRLETQTDARLLVALADGEVVGNCGIHTNANPRRAHAASIGLVVHGNWHGRGVGSALLKEAISLADNWLRLLRLELTVFTDNLAAIKLYQKFGFVIEGTHVGEALRDGRFVDGYSMARIHPHPPLIQPPQTDSQTT